MKDFAQTLWATSDKLSANMDAAEYKHLVLSLIFVNTSQTRIRGKAASVECALSRSQSMGTTKTIQAMLILLQSLK